MIKAFRTSEQARAALAEGIRQVYRLLSSACGPTGCNAIMEDENGNLLLSSQTYSILRNLKSKDPFLDQGIQLAREAALNTERLAGNGSYITLLFINEMLGQGMRLIAAGEKPVFLGRGLKKALTIAEQRIRELAKPFTKEALSQMLSCELANEALAGIVLEAYNKAGAQGSIIVREGHGLFTELEYLEGFELPGGYLSDRVYIKKENKESSMYHPYILIADRVIDRFSQLLPILEQIVEAKAGLVIVAEEIQGEALTLLINNVRKKVFDAIVVKAPGIGRRKSDWLEDLAVFTGGVVLDRDNLVAFDNVRLSGLGSAAEVRIEKDRILFLRGKGQREDIENQIKKIEAYVSAEDTEFMDKGQYYERIGKLEGRTVIIKVGAPSLVQLHEETHRIQAALALVRSAANGGVLPGGLDTMAALAKELWERKCEGTQEETFGKQLLLDAMQASAKSPQAGMDYSCAVITLALNQAVSVVYEWLNTEVLMVSICPDQEDIALMRQGVPIMR